MNGNLPCELIADLLPLYLDNVCSAAGRERVEAHLRECEVCRSLLEEMQAGSAVQSTALPDGETVLRGTARKMNGRALRRAAGITAIVLYWLVYLWQDALASRGDYRYFSYGFHELYFVGYFLVPLLTAVWLLVQLVRCTKERTWRRELPLIVALVVLLAAQASYLQSRSRCVQTTAWTEVEEVIDEYHVAIIVGERRVVLETSPMVTRLLRRDGTVYGFYYETTKDAPDKGTLNGVWDMIEPTPETMGEHTETEMSP